MFLDLDPYHHRQLRSTMKEKELHDHLNWKTLHIHALGNAASDSSLGHLMSFMNDSDAHTNLRYSAVRCTCKIQSQTCELVIQRFCYKNEVAFSCIKPDLSVISYVTLSTKIWSKSENYILK